MGHTFWHALEAVPGAAAVAAEWRAHMSVEQWSAGAGLLKPQTALAASHPCRAQLQCLCNHEIVKHGLNDFAAVCTCGAGCETFSVKRDDLVVLAVDWAALVCALAGALGLVDCPRLKTPPHVSTSLGVLSPTTHFRFPVVLCIAREAREIASEVNGIIAEHGGPFVMLVPTRTYVDDEIESRIRSHKGALVSLTEVAEVDAATSVRLLVPSEQIFDAFLSANVPQPKIDGSADRFPTPPGTRWSEVRIRFTDGHTVTVIVRGLQRTYNFMQMGMADKRNGGPTAQWKLLQGLAEDSGKLYWNSPRACRQNQKRSERLAKDLSRFFGIAGRPITLTEDRKGYRTTFGLAPDK